MLRFLTIVSVAAISLSCAVPSWAETTEEFSPFKNSCMVNFQGGRVRSDNIDNTTMRDFFAEVQHYRSSNENIAYSALWDVKQAEFWKYPVSLWLSIDWPGEYPPPGSIVIFKFDGEEKARQIVGKDPSVSFFSGFFFREQVPNIFGHSEVAVIVTSRDGAVLGQRVQTLSNWDDFRQRADVARHELLEDFRTHKEACDASIIIADMRIDEEDN